MTAYLRAGSLLLLLAAINLIAAAQAVGIDYGQHVSGNISSAGSADTYTFSGTSGNTVAILVARTSGSGYPQIELSGPDGAKLATNSSPTAARVDLRLLKTGTHTIRVSDGSTGGALTYAYNISLERTSPPAPAAASITYGSSLTGTVNATMDAFSFSGVSGNSVFLTIADTGANTDGTDGWPQMDLYGPDGTRLKSMNSPNSVTVMGPLGSTGRYTILVSDGFDGTRSYSYQIALECLGQCQAAPAALQFVPVAPCRIADTRNANGTFGGPVMASSSSRTFPVPQSACSIPAGAQAYSLNVTVVPRSALGYLTLWPTGLNQPGVSTLNSPSGKIVANAAIVPAGTGGGVDVFVTDTTDVVLDIDGYFAPVGAAAAGLAFYPLAPCRISDTRNATGSFGGPSLGAGTARSIPVQASGCGIPAAAQAYSLNATVVPQGSLGYLTLWPAGQNQPYVSTLNSPDGSIVANAAIVPAGTDGAISAFVTNSTDLVLDINGYFAPADSGGIFFYGTTPCRIADTRNDIGPFGGPVMGAGTLRTFPVSSSACLIPSAAQAYSLNATVVPSGSLGYLTLWPAGGAQPYVSTLNSPLGLIVANAAIVPAGTGGSLSAFVTDQTHLILDINGYFAPAQ